MRGLEANSPSVCQRFALSMSDPESRDVRLLVEAALSETDPTVAGSLQWALARSGDAAVPLLQEALGSAEAERRHRAVEALEKINTYGSMGALAQALPHRDPLVNRRAALAVGAIGNPAAIPVLTSLIVEGCDGREAASVLGVLAEEHGLVAEVDRAIGRLLADGEPEERLRLTSALVEIPGPLAAERLQALAQDPDRRVASAARFTIAGTETATQRPR